MGTLLHVRCSDCGADGEQVAGIVMRGQVVRCDTCGDTTAVPVANRRRADRGPQTESGTTDHGADEIAETCECGGSFRPDAPVRCRTCHSRRVSTLPVGRAD